ncbi:HD domain-containing protein [Stenotrophomonas pavanii]|uniref:HD domain-containing protein n=1 Tax=Stenotrophomonas pavanii TaxID=487698 RepID=UPI003F9BEB66
MADILIAHLKRKSDEHGALRTLASQWDFDVKLIPKALQAVGNLFPHYSRHDESHSRQILVNIERLLGESVSLLTATDTWLILEAAYWHDIGMVVPKEDIIKELQGEDFKDFIASIRQSPHHDLFRFASSFDPSNLANCFLGADSPVDAVSRFNELMAEWFRRKHPARAETMVREPWSAAGISSPRTELMPARLFRVLGRICQMHGASFEDLLSINGLPFKEAGMASEDCHPRFVACLLRMGDLLDLDDNRFCPVLQRMAGSDRSSMSKAHEDKHQAIRHLRIDRDRIEVNAECRTIPGYLEAFRWFDWLKEEVQSQMAHWQEIAPSRELGLLPTLGSLTVSLSGDLQILQKGQRPQFGVDEKSVVSLLQGSNLYGSAFPCVRELLQNAVDATLLSIWVRESHHARRDDWSSPSSCEHLRVASPVRIELIESEKGSGEDGKARWLLRVVDGGTGISSADLLHMLRIGGSQKNASRQRLIRDMPEWMKPSGAFGIGFQSAFLLSDCIRIVTKSIFSNETLELELHSPLGPNEGLVLVRRLPNDVAQPYGTTLEITFELDRFAKSWKIPSLRSDDDSVAAKLVMSMDPLLDDAFPYDAGRIVDEAVAFGRNSLVRVVCSFLPLTGEPMLVLGEREPEEGWRFLPDVLGHCVEFRYQPYCDRFVGHESRFLYRGQIFKCDVVRFPYVVVEINLLSEGAGAWLSANRDQLAPKAQGMISAVVREALRQAVEADMKSYSESLSNPPEYSAELSLFLHTMALSEGEAWEKFASQTGDAWKDVPVIGSSVRQCFDKQEWSFGTEVDGNSALHVLCDASIDGRHNDALLLLALLAWKKEKNGSVQVLAVSDLMQSSEADNDDAPAPAGIAQRSLDVQRRTPVLRFSLNSLPRYSEAAFLEHLVQATSSYITCRYLVPIEDERWQGLALREGFKLQARWLIAPCASGPSVMLLPYLFSNGRAQATDSQVERLSSRMQPLLVKELSIDDVKRLYHELIAHIDNKIYENNQGFRDKWWAARTR